MCKILKGGLIILYLLAVSSAGFAQKINYRETDSLTKAGKYEEAIAIFNKYKKKNADDYKLFKDRAYCYLQLGKIAQAQADYDKAIELNPQCQRCYLNYAMLENMRNNLDSALFYINKSISVSDTDAYNYVIRGQIYALKNENFSAEQDFDKAVKMHPNIAEYYFYRSRFEFNFRHTSTAFFDIDKAIRLDPKNGFFYFSRGEYFYSANEFTEALNDFDSALSRGYKTARTYHHRAVILSWLRKNNEAIGDLDIALKMDSSDEAIYVARGTLYFNDEKMDSACRDFVKAEVLLAKNPKADKAEINNINSFLNEYCDPSHASWYYERGISEYNKKNFETAIAYYDAGHDKFPDNPLMTMLTGSAYLALNDVEKAIFYFKKALGKKASYPTALKENNGYRYLYGGALSQYSKGDGNNDSLTDITNFYILSGYERIANAELAIGNLKEAKAYVDSAITEGEKNKFIGMEIIYTTRGRYELLINEPKLALQDFSRAMLLNDKFPEPYTLHAQALLLFSQPARSKKISVVFNIGNPGFMLKTDDLIAYTPPKTGYDSTSLKIAITDCYQAITIAPGLYNAYLIRGYARALMRKEGYCDDFSKAKLLGSSIATEFETKFCR